MKARIARHNFELLEIVEDNAVEHGLHKVVYLPYVVADDPPFDPATQRLSEPSGGIVLDNGVPSRWEVVRGVVQLTEDEIEARDVAERVRQLSTAIAVIEAGTETPAQRRQYLGVLGRAVVWILKRGAILIVLAACLGCTRTEVTMHPGTRVWTLKRSSFLQRVEIPKVTFTPDGSASLSGYKNDGGNEALAAAVSAAVTAAVQSATPGP